MLIFMKLRVVTNTKMFKNSNKCFKQQFLIHLAYVLRRINIVEYSYGSVN
jgi:hypothetical protein